MIHRLYADGIRFRSYEADIPDEASAITFWMDGVEVVYRRRFWLGQCLEVQWHRVTERA